MLENQNVLQPLEGAQCSELVELSKTSEKRNAGTDPAGAWRCHVAGEARWGAHGWYVQVGTSALWGVRRSILTHSLEASEQPPFLALPQGCAMSLLMRLHRIDCKHVPSPPKSQARRLRPSRKACQCHVVKETLGWKMWLSLENAGWYIHQFYWRDYKQKFWNKLCPCRKIWLWREKSAVALTPPKGHQTSCKGAHGSLRAGLDWRDSGNEC